MKKILLFCVFSISLVFGQKTLTSTEAVKIALNKNTDYQKSQTKLSAVESNLKAAYGSFLPTVSGNVGWDWKKTDRESPNSSTQGRTYSAGVGANWTIFNGLSNYADYDANKSSLASARASLNHQKQSIIFNTLSKYVDVVNAQILVKVSEENVTWNQKNLEIIQERNKLGSVTLADVYAQQVKVGNAELALIEAQNNFETIKSNFLFYLGLDVLENYQFEQPVLDKDLNISGIVVSKDYAEISASVASALKNREDIKSVQYSLDAANYSVQSVKGNYLPTLRSNAGFSTDAPGMGDLFKNRTYRLGLTVDIPIFSAWSTDTKVEAALVNAKIQEIELNSLNRDITRSIQINYLDLQAAYKRVEVGSKNVKAALETRRIEEEKYALGSTTLLNVLIANSEYTDALTKYINAQFSYRKLRQELQFLVGSTDAKSFE